MTTKNIDKNMIIETDISKKDICYYDINEPPFNIYGVSTYGDEPDFKRMPDDIAHKVSKNILFSYRYTTGGRVRFSTDSEYIVLYAELPFTERISQMPLSSTGGFDLYIDDPDMGVSRFYKPFLPPYDMKDKFDAKVRFKSRKKRYITINFPNYSTVKKVYIGVQKDAEVWEGAKYKDIPPIVFYGSSITNGACSSRPGNTYPNIISRRLEIDHINLGFGGSCLAEDAIVEYMSTLPMCAFVSEYDHNAPNYEYLERTHYKMYDKIRMANPNIPYIMVSKVDFDNSYKNSVKRRDVIYESYKKAIENGDENVYFVDGSRVFKGYYKEMCSVDGTHPSDLGFAMMADVIGDELMRAFTKGIV